MDLAREAVGRKPLGQAFGIEERTVHFLGGRTQDAVQANCICGHAIVGDKGGWIDGYTNSTNETGPGGHFASLIPTLVSYLDRALQKV